MFSCLLVVFLAFLAHRRESFVFATNPSGLWNKLTPVRSQSKARRTTSRGCVLAIHCTKSIPVRLAAGALVLNVSPDDLVELLFRHKTQTASSDRIEVLGPAFNDPQDNRVWFAPDETNRFLPGNAT